MQSFKKSSAVYKSKQKVIPIVTIEKDSTSSALSTSGDTYTYIHRGIVLCIHRGIVLIISYTFDTTDVASYCSGDIEIALEPEQVFLF